MARDTKLGQEEISRDIPNVGEEALKNLDEAGIVYIGAEVKAGDILVGKVTPKGESPMTPEEKLLRAIFGEKAADVRDTSLKVPPGVEGTVVEVRVFNRRGVDKDERALAIERDEIERLAKDRDDEKAILERSFYSQIQEMLMNQTVAGGLKGLKPGTRITDKVLGEYTPGQWRQIAVKTDKRQCELEASNKQFDESMKRLQDRFDSKVDKLQRGDELPPGVMKMVKVFVATKRKLQPGDKMAGRHGNKGVISRIMPLEDMPYLEEGVPVDIVLNPLGVPSPHERRSDPRNPPRLGRGGSRQEDRRHDQRRPRGVDGAGPQDPARDLRREVVQGRHRRSRRRADARAGAQPQQGRAVRIAGVRRRARARHRRHAGDGRPRQVGPGRPWSTAAPASRSIAR